MPKAIGEKFRMLVLSCHGKLMALEVLLLLALPVTTVMLTGKEKKGPFLFRPVPVQTGFIIRCCGTPVRRRGHEGVASVEKISDVFSLWQC